MTSKEPKVPAATGQNRAKAKKAANPRNAFIVICCGSKFRSPVLFKPPKLPALPQHRRNLQHSHRLRHLCHCMEQQTINRQQLFHFYRHGFPIRCWTGCFSHFSLQGNGCFSKFCRLQSCNSTVDCNKIRARLLFSDSSAVYPTQN